MPGAIAATPIIAPIGTNFLTLKIHERERATHNPGVQPHEVVVPLGSVLIAGGEVESAAEAADLHQVAERQK